MPFVKPAHKRQAAKRSKADKDSLKSKAGDGTKTYKVTMRDRKGFTYTYIIQADASKSVPVLCESRVTAPANNLLSNSLPNMRGSARFPVSASPSRSCASLADGKEDLSKVDEGEKKGLFNSLLQYIRKKTSSKSSKSAPSSSKSKRKAKPLPQRKRQRTVSAMSNLDPIQESPEEDNLDDTDSYSHDSVSCSESDSGDGHDSCP
nr:hypothetical protein BaRGS_030169 [Batillaria attramentaria]